MTTLESINDLLKSYVGRGEKIGTCIPIGVGQGFLGDLSVLKTAPFAMKLDQIPGIPKCYLERKITASSIIHMATQIFFLMENPVDLGTKESFQCDDMIDYLFSHMGKLSTFEYLKELPSPLPRSVDDEFANYIGIVCVIFSKMNSRKMLSLYNLKKPCPDNKTVREVIMRCMRMCWKQHVPLLRTLLSTDGHYLYEAGNKYFTLEQNACLGATRIEHGDKRRQLEGNNILGLQTMRVRTASIASSKRSEYGNQEAYLEHHLKEMSADQMIANVWDGSRQSSFARKASRIDKALVRYKNAYLAAKTAKIDNAPAKREKIAERLHIPGAVRMDSTADIYEVVESLATAVAITVQSHESEASRAPRHSNGAKAPRRALGKSTKSSKTTERSDKSVSYMRLFGRILARVGVNPLVSEEDLANEFPEAPVCMFGPAKSFAGLKYRSTSTLSKSFENILDEEFKDLKGMTRKQREAHDFAKENIVLFSILYNDIAQGKDVKEFISEPLHHQMLACVTLFKDAIPVSRKATEKSKAVRQTFLQLLANRVGEAKRPNPLVAPVARDDSDGVTLGDTIGIGRATDAGIDPYETDPDEVVVDQGFATESDEEEAQPTPNVSVLDGLLGYDSDDAKVAEFKAPAPLCRSFTTANPKLLPGVRDVLARLKTGVPILAPLIVQTNTPDALMSVPLIVQANTSDASISVPLTVQAITSSRLPRNDTKVWMGSVEVMLNAPSEDSMSPPRMMMQRSKAMSMSVDDDLPPSRMMMQRSKAMSMSDNDLSLLGKRSRPSDEN